MAITIQNQAENHRGVYFEFVGDGATTLIKPTHARRIRPGRTVKAFVVTGATKFDTRSERGGLRSPVDGTPVTVASASDNADGSISVTTSAAVGNGVRAYVTVVFDQRGDE